MKFTPGPWANHGRIPGTPGLPHSVVAAKTLIARVYSEAFGDEAQELANARLIAAAPELLEALTNLLAWAQDVHTPGKDAGLNYTGMDDARVALKKATGVWHE